MLRPRLLQAEPQPVQVIQPPLGRHLPAQIGRHPRRHLTPAPQPAIARRGFQRHRQRRHTRLVQQRFRPRVVPATVAETGHTGRVPATDQNPDPAPRVTAHPRHHGDRFPRQQQPDHMKMRPTHNIPLRPKRRKNRRRPFMLNHDQPVAHRYPQYLVAPSHRITSSGNQSTGNRMSGLGVCRYTSSRKRPGSNPMTEAFTDGGRATTALFSSR